MSWAAAPEPEPRLVKAADARAATARRYRRSQVLGLLLLAGVILVATLLRADAHAIFPPGWWRF